MNKFLSLLLILFLIIFLISYIVFGDAIHDFFDRNVCIYKEGENCVCDESSSKSDCDNKKGSWNKEKTCPTTFKC